MSSSSAAVVAAFPASLSDLQLSSLLGDQQKDLCLAISSTSPLFLLVVGDNTQHLIFSCFHSCNPHLLGKSSRWRSSRFHKERIGRCPPLPALQDICSYLKIERSGCCQVPVFSGKPPSSSPYYLCSCCLSAGSIRKRNVKTVSTVRGCSHTAPPLELLQWRGLLFDGVEHLQPPSTSILAVEGDHAAPLHTLPFIPLSSSSVEVVSLSAPPSSSLSSSSLSSSLAMSAPPPLLSSNDGHASSSSSSLNSFTPYSMNLIPRRNPRDIATMPEFGASRKRKRLTEEDVLDEEGVPVLIPEWFQKQNIPSFFNFFIDFNLLKSSSSSSSSSPPPPFKMSAVQSNTLKEVLLSLLLKGKKELLAQSSTDRRAFCLIRTKEARWDNFTSDDFAFSKVNQLDSTTGRYCSNLLLLFEFLGPAVCAKATSVGSKKEKKNFILNLALNLFSNASSSVISDFLTSFITMKMKSYLVKLYKFSLSSSSSSSSSTSSSSSSSQLAVVAPLTLQSLLSQQYSSPKLNFNKIKEVVYSLRTMDLYLFPLLVKKLDVNKSQMMESHITHPCRYEMANLCRHLNEEEKRQEQLRAPVVFMEEEANFVHIMWKEERSVCLTIEKPSSPTSSSSSTSSLVVASSYPVQRTLSKIAFSLKESLTHHISTLGYSHLLTSHYWDGTLLRCGENQIENLIQNSYTNSQSIFAITSIGADFNCASSISSSSITENDPSIENPEEEDASLPTEDVIDDGDDVSHNAAVSSTRMLTAAASPEEKRCIFYHMYILYHYLFSVSSPRKSEFTNLHNLSSVISWNGRRRHVFPPTSSAMSLSHYHGDSSLSSPSSSYPLVFMLEIQKAKALQQVNISFVDEFTSLCYGIDSQFLLSAESRRLPQTWTLDRDIIDTLLHSFFPIVRKDVKLGFKLLRQLKVASQNVVFSSSWGNTQGSEHPDFYPFLMGPSLSSSSSSSPTSSAMVLQQQRRQNSSTGGRRRRRRDGRGEEEEEPTTTTGASSTSSSHSFQSFVPNQTSSSVFLSALALGNGHSITTMATNYGFRTASNVEGRWLLQQVINYHWQQTFLQNCHHHTEPSSSSSAIQYAPPPLSPLLPWYQIPHIDAFLLLKGWDSLNEHQKEDIRDITLYDYIVVVRPCGSGKSVLYEYFTFCHTIERQRRREMIDGSSSFFHPHHLPQEQQQCSSSSSPSSSSAASYSYSNNLECPCSRLLFPPLLLVVPTIALKLQVSIIVNSLNGCSSGRKGISSPRIVAKLLSSAILHDAEAWRDVDLIITCPEGLFLYQNEIKSILCHTSFPISYIDEMHLLWSAKDFRQSMEFVRGFLRTCSSKLVEMTGTFDSVMLSPSFSPSILKGSSDMITSLSKSPAPPIYKATLTTVPTSSFPSYQHQHHHLRSITIASETTTTGDDAMSTYDDFISFVRTNILEPLLLLYYTPAEHEEGRNALDPANIWKKIQILVYCRTIVQVNQLSLLIQGLVSDMFGSGSLYKSPQQQSMPSSSSTSSSRTSSSSSSLPSIAITSIHSECSRDNYDCLKDILEKKVTSYFIVGSSSIVQSCDLPSLSYLIVYDCPFSIVDLFQLFGRAARLSKLISTIVLFKGSSYLFDNLSWNNVDGHLLSDPSSCLLLYSSIYNSVPSFPSSSSIHPPLDPAVDLSGGSSSSSSSLQYHHPHHKPFGSLPSLLKSHLSFLNDKIVMQHQINLETQKILKHLGQTCFMSFPSSSHPPHKNDLKECPNYSKFTFIEGPNQQCFRCIYWIWR